MGAWIHGQDLLTPILIVLGSLVLGGLFEVFVLKRLTQLAGRTKWEGDDILLKSVQGMTTLWFVLVGLYFAVHSLSVPTETLLTFHKLLLVVAILSVTIAVSRAATGMIDKYAKQGHGTQASATIFRNIARLVVFSVGLLIILQSLGIAISPILTALGVGGLAVALALQDTLSNLFAGIQIIVSKKIRPGDYVKLDSGQEGYVKDITWRNTSIQALPNNMIIVPNAKLASAVLTNFYRPENEMAVLVQVGVSYDSDLRFVERVTVEVGREIMKEVQGGVPEFEPFIRYNTFADFSINFTVILRAKEYVDQYLITHEFIKRLHERYKREGIEIPFPIRTLYMKPLESGTKTDATRPEQPVRR